MVLTGTQWVVFDAVTGTGKAGLYKPPNLSMGECRVSLPVGPGDTVARIDGERADDAALDQSVAQGHLYTVADLLALYPEAVVTVVPALATTKDKPVTRYIPAYETVVAQAPDPNLERAERGQLAWESAEAIHEFPCSPDLAATLPDRGRLRRDPRERPGPNEP